MTTIAKPLGAEHSSKPTRDRIGRSVVVGTLGDANSENTVRLAAAIAARDEGQLHAVAAVTPFPHTAVVSFEIAPPPSIDDENRRQAFATLERQIAAVASPGASACAVLGWPAETIADEAARHAASLIVVGLGHHRVVERLLGGETAVALMHVTSVPMLAVARGTTTLPTRAVVGVDFTDSSLRAAELTASLLPPAGELTLVHVSPFAHFKPRDGTNWVEVYYAGAAARLDAECHRIHEATERRVRAVTVTGDATTQLLAAARDSGAEVIAVGWHPKGLLERALVGSVATRLLRTAACSVLVVPQGGAP